MELKLIELNWIAFEFEFDLNLNLILNWIELKLFEFKMILNWIESNWIEFILNWIEFNWIELYWIELNLNWIEMNWFKLNWFWIDLLYYSLFYTIDCRQRQAVNPRVNPREGYARVGLCIYIQYIVGDARNVFPLWCVVLWRFFL